ncbi:MAG: CbtA family protein [Acidimicrobiia bacterium]|nr:CbtA family protein [Acidimicrobiia bacterium]
MKRVLLNGVLAGLAGGLALAVYMLVIGRGPINAALDYEEALAHETEGAGHTHEALFSQGVQEIGGAIGLIIFGIALGVIFAITLAAMAPKLGHVAPIHAAIRLGAIGFIVIVVVPFLKYPANPPAVGDPETINERTIYYFALLGLSIALANGVWSFIHRVERPALTRAWLGTTLYALGLAVIFLALPGGFDQIDAPADLVWDFRLASLGGLATTWAVMSLTMGTLLTRQAQSRLLPQSALTPA